MVDDNIKYEIGEWYDSVEKSNNDKLKRGWSIITQINKIWFDKIPIPVIFQSEDPYDSYQDMKETVEQEQLLRVFDGGEEPYYISHEDNLRGRAVHDWFGHLQADCDFSFEGEWTKFNHVKTRYPEWVRPLLFTEVVGQRCAYAYNSGFDFEQKSVFAPWTIIDKTRKHHKEN